ncbi:restriction endonuclease-related protein [Pseudomonas sp. SDO55104_S430]
MDTQLSQRLLLLLAHAATCCHNNRAAALPLLREASALLWRVNPDQPPLRPMALEDLLSRPATEWLPEFVRGDYEGAFLAAGLPTVTCHEVAVEMEAKQIWNRIQSKVKDVRDRCRLKQHGDEQYRRFRRLLIEEPVITPMQVAPVFIPLSLQVDEFYEDIPPHLQIEGKIYRCPECRWPMHPLKQDVECISAWCREKQSLYYRDGKKLRNRVNGVALDGEPTAGKKMLMAPFWKFTLLPGLLELSLAREVAALGLAVTLWPEVDRADLRVRIGTQDVDIDAKVWSSPHQLAYHANSLNRPTAQWIVIPDYQSMHIPLLRELIASSISVYTERECIKELRRLANTF